MSIQIFNRVSFVEKMLFTKHLAIMLKAGINLSEAMEVLLDQTQSKALRKILNEILKDVKNGQALAMSLKKYPKVFDQFYIGLVEVGEEAGTLQQNFEYLVKQTDKSYILRKKIKGAMLYPASIFLITVVIGGFIAFFILPKLVDFFDAFNTKLPLATRILLLFATIMKNYGIYIIVGSALAISGFMALIQTKVVKPIWQRLILHTPLFGKLIKNNQIAVFTRNFGILLQSGVPVSRSLEASINTLTNSKYQYELNKIYQKFLKGISIAESLEAANITNIIPPLVTKMVQVGEKTGKLDETLIYLADFYEDEIDNITKNLTTVLEPILLVVIGITVAFVALAIITPIYDITGSIR
jgi:type IV pilus assembly protein PilC